MITITIIAIMGSTDVYTYPNINFYKNQYMNMIDTINK